jgi:hypothetical protein
VTVWRMFVDDKLGGIEASSSWGSCPTDRPGVVDRVFWGEILVDLLDSDAVPPEGGTNPSWRASWLPFVHFPLCAGGNPRTSLLVRATSSSLSLLKVLLGA